MSQYIRTYIYALLIFVVSGASWLQAQSLGNEWIDYSQQYYKFPITKDGVYRISQTTLVNAGIPLAGIDPRSIQIFFRGQEIPLYIEGEADGVFDAVDFIEFFGQKNDGWLDTTLYVNGVADQVNPGYSIFNDTSVYYFTWNTSTSNLRFTLENDTTFSAYTPANYYWYKAFQSYTSHYFEGEIISELTSPEYTYGEGYYRLFNNASSFSENWVSTPLNGFQATINDAVGQPSRVKLHIVSVNNPTGGDDHHHIISVADIPMLDTTLNAYNFYKKEFTVSSAALKTSTAPFKLDFQAAGPTFDPNTDNGIGYYEINMPQQYSFNGRAEQYMYVPDAVSESKVRMDLAVFNNMGTNVWLYDLSTGKRISTVNNAGVFQALVPNTGGIKKMYVASEGAFNSVAQLKPVSTDPTHFARFRDFNSVEANKNYILITHPKLMAEAEIYRDYRVSTGYTTLLVDINEIYDQFGFGIRNHPTSIRNFLKMTDANWSVKPEHVFLIGKSLKHTLVRTNPSWYSKNLLPSMGIMPCDNMLAYNITGNGKQYCGIGRLAASTSGSVLDYYNKVNDYENVGSVEWRKHILHFGGGGTGASTFLSYLNGYKDIIEDTLYGGQVNTYIKTTSDPFPTSMANQIRDEINAGTSLITVFGHSSGQGFDQNVDDPEGFTNFGKYPWYIVNGCLSGDLFQYDSLISERFVLLPDRGAIGFIASTSLGFAATLKTITDSVYYNLGVRNYGAAMGTIHKNAITQNEAGLPYFSLLKMNALNFQLHGDPGLKFNYDTLPDLELLESNVSFLPPVVTTEMDSFTMRIVVNNLGKVINNHYQLDIFRNYTNPQANDTLYSLDRPFNYFKDTVEIVLPVDLLNSVGENVFTITADPLGQYNEILETNNQIVVKLNIISSDIVPVYPYKYAVIPNNHTYLKASTGDAFAPVRTYKFEMDTTDLFNSPFKRDTIITQSGGVVQWHPNVTFTDSTVYFWRTGVDSAGTGNFYRWKESSFQYIPGKYGWGQDHFFQFKDDEYVYIEDNRLTRTFDFIPNAKELKVITYGLRNTGDPFNAYSKFMLDGFNVEASGCGFGNATLLVFVIDPITLEPWGTNYGGANPTHVFGNANCRSRVEYYFHFNLNDPLQEAGLANMLATIPNDYYIGAYTFNGSASVPVNLGAWDPAVVSAFQSLGADTISSLVSAVANVPYAFFTRKGDTTSTVEVVGASPGSVITLTAPLQNDWYFGTITSELIGPASEWKSFHWATHTLDADPSNDTANVSIIGIKEDGTQQTLVHKLPVTVNDLYTLGDSIDAATYPYLKLFMFNRDDSTQTPLQIDHWHVMYEGVPECALNPAVHYYYSGDTISEGGSLTFSTAIENIGDYDMDSLSIRYFIVDNNGTTHDYYVTRDSLLIGEFMTDTFSISTEGFDGINSFYIEANPYAVPYHQPEQVHFNNIAVKNLVVNSDNMNPLLDVTFDGIHIMDGDVISAKPIILIQVKDENLIQLMNDTADFELYIKRPSVSTPTRIYFGNPEVTFYPATNSQNYAKIEIRPDFTTEDGTYELRVRAKDQNNNISGNGDGNYDYKIKFEVINQSTITHIFNYPNPFSTSTQWVFTLTGSELPSEFTIRIMTISGIVVREITLNELGPIHIGKNITQFKWNGTDEYGDKLATGVYIYQVITKINGETIDHRSTSADKYFKNNYGKLYILR